MHLSPQKQNPAGGRGLTSSQTIGNALHQHSTGLPIDALLARLEGVQRSGKGFRAQCPNCGGKSRKLAIAESADGTLLVKCFSCHDTPGILSTLGLTLANLFPQRIKNTSPEGRREARESFRQAAWAAALGVLSREATIVEVAGTMIERGEPLAPEDLERVRIANVRIHDVREALQ